MTTIHSAEVVCDSVTPVGARLTSLFVTMPRIVLAEFNTHRQITKSSASSRAIPTKRMLDMVEQDPYIPSHWGKNQKGMQADEEVDAQSVEFARHHWLEARQNAIESAKSLLELGIHKQITNRLLEPFMWHVVLATATTWDNFFHLRIHPAAHPDIRLTAEAMKVALDASRPTLLQPGEWHLPFIKPSDIWWAPPGELQRKLTIEDLTKLSVGRSARLSYLTHDGRFAPEEDIGLHDRLLSMGHMAPFEHVAQALETSQTIGNFTGWRQLRKTIPFEHDIMGAR